ncbi:hypothetical protein HZS_3471 [Henneguya salminicola]|nr:hypothetical protein HZS_3471 [Henneguya salminicola]
MEYNWMPCIITTDFKKALISSIKQEFPESKIYGGHFHLKQAIRKKKSVTYKISGLNMSIILSKMELLTPLSHRQTNDAITYIQTFLVEREG